MIDLIDDDFKPYSEQDILDNFPKEDFYVVFGSSHSAGWCDNGQERLMAREKNWASQLEKKIGKPVFNLAMGGIMPQTMLEIVCDFVYYYTQQDSKCLGAFIEPRPHDYCVVKDVSHYFLSKNPTIKQRKLNMFKHQAIALGRDYHTKNNLSCYYNVFQVGRQLNAANHIKYKDIDKHTVNWIRSRVEHEFLGARVHFDCLNILLRMTQVLTSHSIPNYTFYWEVHEPDLDDDSATERMQQLYYSTMEEYIKRGINYIRADDEEKLHKRSFDMLKMVRDRKGEQFMKDNICKCEHYNENVSAVVADILYEKVIK